MSRELPQRVRVTGIIPCRNEADFIATCLDSVVALDHPAELLEIFLVDGMSSDGTPEILRSYAQRYPFIRVLENPKRTLAAGWNVGLRHATGDVVCAMIAHQTYRPDYIATSLRYLREYDADVVGGVLRTLPQVDDAMGRAIAAAWSHPFGVGNARFRTGADRPTWVDNVHCGVFRRSALELVGGYNEELTRSQDADLQTRLKAKGGRILLIPESFSEYYTRSRYGPFARFCVINGYWVVRPLRHGAFIRSIRHWIPLLFVASLVVLAAAALFVPAAGVLLAGEVAAYLAAALVVAGQIAWRKRDARYLVLLPLVLATLHVGYGVGAAFGAAQLIWERIRGIGPRGDTHAAAA